MLHWTQEEGADPAQDFPHPHTTYQEDSSGDDKSQVENLIQSRSLRLQYIWLGCFLNIAYQLRVKSHLQQLKVLK